MVAVSCVGHNWQQSLTGTVLNECTTPGHGCQCQRWQMTLSNWNANVKGRLPTMSIVIVYSLSVKGHCWLSNHGLFGSHSRVASAAIDQLSESMWSCPVLNEVASKVWKLAWTGWPGTNSLNCSNSSPLYPSHMWPCIMVSKHRPLRTVHVLYKKTVIHKGFMVVRGKTSS